MRVYFHGRLAISGHRRYLHNEAVDATPLSRIMRIIPQVLVPFALGQQHLREVRLDDVLDRTHILYISTHVQGDDT